jgi:hypothetical protein
VTVPGRSLAPILALVCTLVACGDQSGDDTVAPATEPPESQPTLTGEITDVVPFEPVTEDCVQPGTADPDAPVSSDDSPFCSDPEAAPLGTVLVEEDPSAASGDTKISFTVDRDTLLLAERSGTHDPLSFGDLDTGMAVAAWADGAIAESYPAQARAAAIVVRPS